MRYEDDAIIDTMMRRDAARERHAAFDIVWRYC